MFVKTFSVVHQLSNTPDTATCLQLSIKYFPVKYLPIKYFSIKYFHHGVMSLKEVTDGLPQAFLSSNSKDSLSIFMQTIESFQSDFSSEQPKTSKRRRRTMSGSEGRGMRGGGFAPLQYSTLQNSPKLEIRVRNNPSPVSVFSFSRYPRERFEHANICISPTFQETVGCYLKPSLPVITMTTLNQFN